MHNSKKGRRRVLDLLLSVTPEIKPPRKSISVISLSVWRMETATRPQEKRLTLDRSLFLPTLRSQCNNSSSISKVLQDGTQKDSKSSPVSTFTSRKTNRIVILRKITSVWTTRCWSFWPKRTQLKIKSRKICKMMILTAWKVLRSPIIKLFRKQTIIVYNYQRMRRFISRKIVRTRA